MLLPSAPGIHVREKDGARIDYSNASEGYIIASVAGESDRKYKINIKSGSGAQNFSVPYDGTPKVYPLCFGDGTYTVQAFKQVELIQYRALLGVALNVELSSQFVPFLYPNTYCEYDADSVCVKKAAELTAGVERDIDKVKALYRWICDNTEYDHELAKRVKDENWWLPDPDEVIATGKTICFGYSSLMAAMSRSLSIPCRICVGYAGASFHAWNEIYTRNGGDIDGVKFSEHCWNRLCVTFMDTSDGKAADYVMTAKNWRITYYG